LFGLWFSVFFLNPISYGGSHMPPLAHLFKNLQNEKILGLALW